MSAYVLRSRYCNKLVGFSLKCGIFSGISRLYHSIPEIMCNFCLLSATLNSGSAWSRTMSAVAMVSRAWSKIWGQPLEFRSYVAWRYEWRVIYPLLATLRCKITLDKAGLKKLLTAEVTSKSTLARRDEATVQQLISTMRLFQHQSMVLI